MVGVDTRLANRREFMVRVPPEKQKRKHLHCPFFPAKQAFSRSAQNDGFGRMAAFNSTKVLPNIRHCRIFSDVRTVAETPIFQKYASDVWSDNPEAGDVIPGSGGCRKVRWSSAGQGKRGGARVIYFNATEAAIWLLIVYKKAKFDNLPTAFLAELKKGVEDGL